MTTNDDPGVTREVAPHAVDPLREALEEATAGLLAIKQFLETGERIDGDVVLRWCNAATAALAAAPQPEGIEAKIYTFLREYRQEEVHDEDGYGYPLVDALTLDGHGIDMGEREIYNLARGIAHMLGAPAPQPATPGQRMIRAAEEATAIARGDAEPANVYPAPQAAPVDPLRGQAEAIISDWEEQASERDRRDPMRARIMQEAAVIRAALAAAPQPAPVDREALVEALRAQRQADADGTLVTVSRQAVDEAISLIAAGLRLPGAVQPTMRDETGMEHIARDIREGRFPKRSPRQQVPDTPDQPAETLAWAVIDDDGTPSLVNYDRLTAVHLAGHGEQVVRVAIRIVEDEA